MKWCLSGSQWRDKYSEKGIDIYSKLELEETLDVVKHVSTPLSGRNDWVETVIHDQDIACFFADVSSSDIHTETDICFL